MQSVTVRDFCIWTVEGVARWRPECRPDLLVDIHPDGLSSTQCFWCARPVIDVDTAATPDQETLVGTCQHMAD
jgi:hypothetical protein